MLDKRTKIFVDIVIKKKKVRLNKSLIALAQNNRVLFYVANIAGQTDVIEVGETWIEKLKKTIDFIQKNLGRSFEYSITRTYKYVPFVTFDVDLFSPESDFKKVVKRFKELGCKILSHDGSLGGRIAGAQVNVKKKSLLTIDYHQNFTWQKRKFLDIELLKDYRMKNIAGINSKVPSAEVEFLLCMADIGHERYNVTLLDLVWLKGLSEEIKDWDLIFDQTRKYGWHRTFRLVASRINGMSLDVYNKVLIPDIKAKMQGYSLPYFVPLWICWISYLENILANGQLPFTSFAYLHYCRLRYYLSGRKRMPYYDDWFIQD